jgi:D-psicose/D-tagatose/L-ribulose 3-epimerase
VAGKSTVPVPGTLAALAAAGFDGDLVGEAFINMPPALAKALSVWRPVARSAEEVLDPGMTYLKRLAVENGLVGG